MDTTFRETPLPARDLRPAPDHARTIHDRLVQAVRQRRTAEHAAAVLLRQVADERLHRALGFASVFDYAEQALDLSVRQTRGLLQIGGALPALPVVNAAFAAGRLPWTKVRELLRVATPETEEAWVTAATSNTSRALERMLSKAQVGETPRAPDDDPRGAARCRVVFEMEASDAALLRDALALVRSQAGLRGEEVNDGAALAAIAQRVIFDAEGEGAPIAERYRVVVTRCPGCGDEHAANAEVSETIALQSACDAEIVQMDGPERGRLTRNIPPATRRAVLHRDRLQCVVPGCRCRLWLDVHHLRARAAGGTHDEANLVTLCSQHHRLVHDGMLGVERGAGGGIEVRHADGRWR